MFIKVKGLMQGISIFVKTIKPFKLGFSWICLCRYGLLGIDKQRVKFSDWVDSCLTKLFDLLVRCIYIELLGKLLDSLEWSRKIALSGSVNDRPCPGRTRMTSPNQKRLIKLRHLVPISYGGTNSTKYAKCSWLILVCPYICLLTNVERW